MFNGVLASLSPVPREFCRYPNAILQPLQDEFLMQIPPDLRDSLSDRVLIEIAKWWSSLTPDEQLEIRDASQPLASDYTPLPNLDDVDPDDEHFPIYEYLVNHELRTVGFIAEDQKDSFHKFASSYLATLGSDYRHGERGSVC